jgi:hypothetical protein
MGGFSIRRRRGRLVGHQQADRKAGVGLKSAFIRFLSPRIQGADWSFSEKWREAELCEPGVSQCKKQASTDPIFLRKTTYAGQIDTCPEPSDWF